jgi:serine/threonine protein kinase
MFECLTGTVPHRGESPVETMAKHTSARVPLLHDVRPDKRFPPQLEDIGDKCLSKNPEGRWMQ